MRFRPALILTALLRAPLNSRIPLRLRLVLLVVVFPWHATTPADKAENVAQDKLRRLKPIRLISASDARAAGSYREIPLANAPEAALSERASDVLQKQTGVQVNRSGAPGTQSLLSIRGSSPDQVEYFIEGMPLPRPLTTPFNLENLPLPLFESVELYPSFVPSHLPGANLGGALNFRLLKPEGERTRYLAQVTANSLLGNSIAAARQTNSSLHFVNFEQSRNRYTYTNNNGTPENSGDDRQVSRENEDFSRIGYTGYGETQSGKWQFSALADVLHSERGIPGVQNLLTQSARKMEERLAASAKAVRPLGESSKVQFFVTSALDRTQISDAKREIIAQTSQTTLSPQVMGGTTFGYRTSNLDAAIHVRSRFQTIAIDSTQIADRREIQGAMSGAFDQDLFRIALQVTASADEDRAAQNAFYASREKVFLGQGYGASALFAVRPLALFRAGDRVAIDRTPLEVYAQATSAYRSPTLYERFGDGIFVTPTETLRGERAITNAAGVRGAVKCPFGLVCSWRSEAWLTGAKDFILFTQNSARTLIAINASSAQIMGVENEAQLNLPQRFLLTLRYTYLDARDYGGIPYYQDKVLPFRPRHQAIATLALLFGAIRSITAVEYRGAVFRDRYNSYGFYLPSKILLDTGIDYMFDSGGSAHTLNLTLKNITDNREADFIGYPVPGRYVLCRWTVQF